MNRSAWIIRLAKVNGNWRALQPVYTTHRGKEVLSTTQVVYKNQPIPMPSEGHWEIEWIEGGKRRRQRVEGYPVEIVRARDAQALRLKAVAAGIAVQPATSNGKRDLKQAVDEFLAEKKRNKAKKTHQAHQQVLTLFQTTVKHKYLEDIKRSDIMDKFVGAMQEQGLSDRTVNHRFCVLLSFLKANDLELVTQRDAPRYVKTDIRCYTAEDLTALFAACNPDERLLFRFLLGTGVREQECMYAEASDLLDECHTLLIREKKQWNFQPKGRKERRVPLPDALALELQAHIKTLKNTLLFPHPSGRPEGHLLRRLKAVVERAKLKATYGSWTLHLFRHTMITMHLQNGVDVRTIMRWVGHEDLATTMRYLDWINSHSDEARRLVNKTFATTFAPVVPTLQLAGVTSSE
jgi:integrase